MKLKKILAAVAAAAVAVSTMAVNAFALVNKVEPITLNSGDENGKVVQYNLDCFDVGEIKTVQIIGTLPADTWYGGGGALGFDTAENGWVQIDFELGKNDAYKVDDSGNMDVTLDFAAASKSGTVNKDKEDGLVQLGWWWGSGDGTVNITDIIVNGESIMGKEAAAPAETEAAPEEEAAAPAEEEAEAAPEEEEADEPEADVDEEEEEEEEAAPAVTEAPAAEVAPAVENTPAPATGNTAVASVVAVMVVAGAAAIAAKKRK